MRMCLGCRESRPKRELVRVVRSPERKISIDMTGKSPGRGAYICRSRECLKRAISSKAFDRAFEQSVDASMFKEIMLEFSESEEDR